MGTIISGLISLSIGLVVGFIFGILLQYWALKRTIKTSLWKYGRSIATGLLRTIFSRKP